MFLLIKYLIKNVVQKFFWFAYKNVFKIIRDWMLSSPVSTQRCFDVHLTSIAFGRRWIDVKTTSCVLTGLDISNSGKVLKSILGKVIL